VPYATPVIVATTRSAHGGRRSTPLGAVVEVPSLAPHRRGTQARSVRVRAIAERPLEELPYLNAARGGGVERASLPVLDVAVDALPAGLDAVVAASDLQGRDARDPARLLGVAVAELLAGLGAGGLLPPAARVGVCLCGDLYTVPAADERGGTGDVTTVWCAFAERFRWVAGVAGNHDVLPGGAAALDACAHLLDGDVRELDGLRIGGVSGIVGALERHNRRPPEVFVGLMRSLLARPIDLLLLHEAPTGMMPDQRGNAVLRDVIEASVGDVPPLVLCGHTPWGSPLAEIAGGVQVLNLEARVAVLRAARV